MSESPSASDFGTLFYLFDVAIAARTLYCFCRTYFTAKLRKDDLRKAPKALLPSTPSQTTPKKKKPVRVYMDGCFDSMHFGHANALRQAKALGDILIVGINPTTEICKHKGPPVMTDEERRIAVASVKWVDEVIVNVPYVLTHDFLQSLIKEHNVDIIVHGDDPCIGADGQDVYKVVKETGMFRTVKRTEGVSSTDIVGRMLLCTRDHHVGVPSKSNENIGKESTAVVPAAPPKPFTRASTFLPTTRRLIQFAGVPRAPRPGDRVVYCDGTFDMFHAGHIETLRKARENGDFLLVGIYDDATVNARKGSNFPIMNVHERTLAVLSCRYVDEVIIGAPWAVTEDMVKTMNISKVVHGSLADPSKSANAFSEFSKNADEFSDPYEVPRRLGILEEFESASDLTVERVLERIVRNRAAFVKRNAKKEAMEKEYLTEHKQFVQEG